MSHDQPLIDPAPGASSPVDPSSTPESSGRRTVACSCGAAVSGELSNCNVCGRFLPTNTAAMTHGLRRARLTPKELDRYTEALDELHAQYGDPGIVLRYQMQEFAMLSVHIARLDEHLAEHGTLTTRGRQPAAMTARLALGARRDQVAARIREAVPETRTRTTLAHLSLPELLSRTERLAEDARALAQQALDQLQVVVHGDVRPLLAAPAPAAEPGAVGAADDAPAAPPCSYCGDRPCCGKDHAAYSTLHYNDPEEVERRRVENTAVMYRTVGKTSPYL